MCLPQQKGATKHQRCKYCYLLNSMLGALFCHSFDYFIKVCFFERQCDREGGRETERETVRELPSVESLSEG